LPLQLLPDMIQAHPHTVASELALKIYAKVLAAVRGDRLVKQAVQRAGSELSVQDHRVDLTSFSRVFVCGSGKASLAMAQALVELLGEWCSGGLVVTKEGHAEALPGITVVEAGHPLPTASSLESGERMLSFAASCDETDLVIFLLSGGASALLEAPVEGIGLADLIATNRTLIASGADIKTINSVRSRISRTKAGGLARAFAPATVIVLALSDVVGNDLQSIGSGPFVQPRESAIPFSLLASLPDSVRAHLRYPPLKQPTPPVPHFVIGSVSLALHEAADAARSEGLLALPYQDPLKGEARVMGRQIVREAALQVTRQTAPFCMIFGGETTVTVRGEGLGGRCQEMAAAASWQLSKLSTTALLAAGPDGADGPTVAAGAIIDTDSCRRAHAEGASLRQALRENDCFAYLQSCDGLIVTGPTGSNVNDLTLVVHAD
jgi:glycerate-2-kinase